MQPVAHRLANRLGCVLAGVLAVAAQGPARAGSPPSPGRAGFPADPAFDRYADRDLLAQAWAEKNAALLTDVGLQLAEGERVLFRPRAGITADQVLGLAARVAGEKKDQKTLARLGRALEALKKSELLSQVAAAQQFAKASRAPEPALGVAVDRLSPEAFLLFRETLDSITAAKIAGDGEALDIIAQLTPTLTQVPEAQRQYLIKAAGDARAALPADAGTDPAVEALNLLLDRPAGDRAPRLESNLLGVTYEPTYKGLRVTGELSGGAANLGKGARLAKGDLVLRVGNRQCYGDATNLDLLAAAAATAGNRDLVVYNAKTRQVRTYELPAAAGAAGAGAAEAGATSGR